MKRTSLLLPFPAGIFALADSFFAFPEPTNHKDNPTLGNEAKSPSAAGKAENNRRKQKNHECHSQEKDRLSHLNFASCKASAAVLKTRPRMGTDCRHNHEGTFQWKSHEVGKNHCNLFKKHDAFLSRKNNEQLNNVV